jgi:hypothetical protein
VYLLFLVYFLLQIKIRALQLFIKAYAVTRCKERRCYESCALFSLPQSSKFFHSLSITSIFNRLHGVLNVGKKIVGPWLDNICQIRRKWYYSSGWNFLQSKKAGCRYPSPGHDLKGVLGCPSTLPSSVSIGAWLSQLTYDALGWGADRDGTDPSRFHGCLVATRVE